MKVVESDVLRHFGDSKAEMGRQLGVSRQLIKRYFDEGFSGKVALAIETKTRGEVKALDLISDSYFDDLFY